LKYGPKIKKTTLINISAYFDPALREEVEGRMLTWIREHSPLTRVKWELQVAQDWLHEWKKHFRPFSIAGLHFVPAWEDASVFPVAKTVIVEPGMAFGTGTHATTQFAIEILKRLWDDEN